MCPSVEAGWFGEVLILIARRLSCLQKRVLLPPDCSTRSGRSGDRRVLRYRPRTVCIANARHVRRDCSAQVLRLQRVSNPVVQIIHCNEENVRGTCFGMRFPSNEGRKETNGDCMKGLGFDCLAALLYPNPSYFPGLVSRKAGMMCFWSMSRSSRGSLAPFFWTARPPEDHASLFATLSGYRCAAISTVKIRIFLSLAACHCFIVK